MLKKCIIFNVFCISFLFMSVCSGMNIQGYPDEEMGVIGSWSADELDERSKTPVGSEAPVGQGFLTPVEKAPNIYEKGLTDPNGTMSCCSPLPSGERPKGRDLSFLFDFQDDSCLFPDPTKIDSPTRSVFQDLFHPPSYLGSFQKRQRVALYSRMPEDPFGDLDSSIGIKIVVTNTKQDSCYGDKYSKDAINFSRDPIFSHKSINHQHVCVRDYFRQWLGEGKIIEGKDETFCKFVTYYKITIDSSGRNTIEGIDECSAEACFDKTAPESVLQFKKMDGDKIYLGTADGHRSKCISFIVKRSIRSPKKKLYDSINLIANFEESVKIQRYELGTKLGRKMSGCPRFARCSGDKTEHSNYITIWFKTRNIHLDLPEDIFGEKVLSLSSFRRWMFAPSFCSFFSNQDIMNSFSSKVTIEQ